MAGSPIKKARRIAAGARPIDPLDEAAPRPALPSIPWNKVQLTGEQVDIVARALAQRRTRAEVATALGVSAHTLRRIVKDTPALGQAIESADEAELEEIRSLLLAHGRAGDTTALIFLGKSFHGLRDRDDKPGKDEQKAGGVLLVPLVSGLEEWSAAAAIQQAKYRERPVCDPVVDVRTRTELGDSMAMQRVLPGDVN